MSIAGGLSWEDALTPLRGVSALAVIFMVIFIVITVFAVPRLHCGCMDEAATREGKMGQRCEKDGKVQ